MEARTPPKFDRQVMAANVKGARLSEGLSQTELARRSGVDLASVYRVEKGKSVHLRTVKKIAIGLNILFEDLLLQKSRQDRVGSFNIHRAKLAKWFPNVDLRPRLPLDHLDDYQVESERHRLGELGFVPFFMCPPLIIPPNGPGVVLLELYGNAAGPFNSEFYEDGAIYVLKGKAAGAIGEENFELDEGDLVAFKTKDLGSFGVAPGHDMAVILWIGATRVKKSRQKAVPNQGGR
jgi:transcriptional regulator with XRE-family HTH domain